MKGYATIDSTTNMVKSTFGWSDGNPPLVPCEEGCYLIPILDDEVFAYMSERLLKLKGLRIKDKTAIKYEDMVEELEERNTELETEIMELKEYLLSTDFYFVRQLDSGKPVPTDVKSKRNQIRVRLAELGL